MIKNQPGTQTQQGANLTIYLELLYDFFSNLYNFILTFFNKIQKTEELSLTDAAELMPPYYEEGSNLTEFIDFSDEDFYAYHNYG